MAPNKSKATDSKAIVLSGDIDVTEIPNATRSSHKWESVIERAKTLPKGKAFSFVVNGRSSVENLKKKLKTLGYDLTTVTNRDTKGEPTDVTVYVKHGTTTPK